MNLFELRHKSTRLPIDDFRLQNILPIVSASRDRTKKRSLLLEVDSNAVGRDTTKQPMSLVWNLKMRRTSTNLSGSTDNYFSEAIQINSARRMSGQEEKENLVPLPTKPQTRELSRRNRLIAAEDLPKTANSKNNGRQFRVTRHQKHSEFIQTKEVHWDQEESQAPAKLQRIHPQGIETEPDLYELANTVIITEILHPPKSPSQLIVIVNIELFLIENSLWIPLRPVQRMKPETRSTLSYLAQHSSLVFMHSNAQVLKQFSEKVAEWKIPAWCCMLINVCSRKQHMFYDLSEAIQQLQLPPSCEVYLIDAITEEKDLRGSILLPLCRSSRVGLLLYRTNRKPGDCSNLTQLLHFKDQGLELRSSEYRILKTEDILQSDHIFQKLKLYRELRAINQIKRQSSQTSSAKTPLPSLQDFKIKLTRYIKALQAENTLPQKSSSANFIVGDLVKRNYQIYSQLQNNKYTGVLRHQRVIQEIEAIRISPEPPSKLYNCSVFLINL